MSEPFQRESVIDYSFPYWTEFFDWATHLPKQIPGWLAIFRPFTLETWILYAFIVAIAGPVLAILVHLAQTDKNSHYFGLGSSTLYVISIFSTDTIYMTKQLPHSSGPRLFLVAWWFARQENCTTRSIFTYGEAPQVNG